MKKINIYVCLFLFFFVNFSAFSNNNRVIELVVSEIVGKRDFYDYLKSDFTSFFGLNREFYLKFNNRPKKIELLTSYDSIDNDLNATTEKTSYIYEYLHGRLIKLSVNNKEKEKNEVYNYIYKDNKLYKIDFNNLNHITFEYDNNNRLIKIERIDGLVLNASYYDNYIEVITIKKITPIESLFFIFEFKNGIIHKFNNFLDNKFYTFSYLPNNPNNIIEKIVEENSNEQIGYHFVYNKDILLKEVLKSRIGVDELWRNFTTKEDTLRIYQISHRFLLREEVNVTITTNNLYYDLIFSSNKLSRQKMYNKKDLANEKRYDVFENLIYEYKVLKDDDKETDKYFITY